MYLYYPALMPILTYTYMYIPIRTSTMLTVCNCTRFALFSHQTDIEAIIESAQHEQNLENQLNDIKEEWTEQVCP